MRDGVDPELDELRSTSRGGRETIAAIERRERERTAIPSVFSPTRATSRTGLEAPSTNWSPGRNAVATADATCRPVASGYSAS